MSTNSAPITFPDAGELPAAYAFERTLLIGSFIGAMAWGIQFSVYGTAMYFSFIRLGRIGRLSWVLMAYMTIVFAMSTTYVGTNIQSNGKCPAGLASSHHLGCNLGTSAACHHAYSIYRQDIRTFCEFQANTLLAMGILLIYTSAQQGHTFNSADAVEFGTTYFSISLSLTVIVTLIVVARLVYLQRLVSKALGNTSEYRYHYISAWSIILESSAMYSVVGFIFLVLYNKNNPVSNIFTQWMVQVMCISSELVILRVATGSAWTARTSEEITSLILSSGPLTDTKIESSSVRTSVSGSRLYADSEV
ncbi:hypothetical protein C8J56DRAFT_1031238 [Mycena floridula]|nr:hypothetical protein C8J56DRAFT_1031238 [Mycena floridula]